MCQRLARYGRPAQPTSTTKEYKSIDILERSTHVRSWE